MRLPVESILRHPFQHLSRARHFVVELRNQRIDDGHSTGSLSEAADPVCYPCRPKSTRGTRSASGGALNTGYSRNPKMPAVMFEGNCRRSVLYSCTRSL